MACRISITRCCHAKSGWAVTQCNHNHCDGAMTQQYKLLALWAEGWQGLCLPCSASDHCCLCSPGAVIRNSASVTYKLFAVTPWKGLLPLAASATSATAGAAESRYMPKLAANAGLTAAVPSSCVLCCSGHCCTLLLRWVALGAVAEHLWLFSNNARPTGLCAPHISLGWADSILGVF